MLNHDLARLTMIMASVPWLRTLGCHIIDDGAHSLEHTRTANDVVGKHERLKSRPDV